MSMPDTSTYTFSIGETGEVTMPGTVIPLTGFTFGEDELWYKITYGTMSKTKGPYWFNPSKGETVTTWTLKLVDIDDPSVAFHDGWLIGGSDLAPQGKSTRGSGETVQIPSGTYSDSAQLRGHNVGILLYNMGLYGKLNITITTYHVLHSITYGTPTGGSVSAKISGEATSGVTSARMGDVLVLSNTPASGYLFRRYVITDRFRTFYQTSNTYTMLNSDVMISADFTPENEPPTFTTSVAPVKVNRYLSDGLYVKKLTQIKADILNAQAAAPKTIAGYSIKVSGYGSANAATYTTATLSSAGTVRIEFTVTDSNGNSATQWEDVEVLDYNYAGANIMFARCGDAQMSSDPLGSYVKYKVESYCSNVDNNYVRAVTLQISGTSTVKQLVDDGNWHVIDGFTIPAENSTQADLTVFDKFLYTRTTTVTIPSANYAIYMSSDGTSIGFGRATTHQNSFEIGQSRTVYVGWNTAQNEQYTLDDYIALKAGNTINEAYVVA